MSRPNRASLAWVASCLAIVSTAATADPARYALDIEITWSEATAPFDWPGNDAHLTVFFGTTHDDRYVLFADGRTASSGLRSVAEAGRIRILRAEIEDAQRRGRIGETWQAEAPPTVPGRVSATFTATEDHPMLSFVTMIAPSPDWFTGLASVNLRADGEWVDSLRLPLWAWDAGTDSGARYTAPNAETQPAQSIRLLAGPEFLTSEGLVPVGYAVLTRVQ